jgi:hypothetical protein
MGYTHYWYRKTELDADKFSNASDDCKRMCQTLKKNGVKIVYEFDEPKDPVFTDDKVRFNGCGDNGHETFYIAQSFSSRGPSFGGNKEFAFCKTAHKPYDIAVCACLIIFKHWFPDMDVSSDGQMQDWQNGLDAVKSEFGEEYVKDFKFSRED